jgi:hypothetical protein
VGRDSGGGDSEGDVSVTDSRTESGGDSAGDGEAKNSDQAFTVPWYEARRGESIAPRFNIPDRFDSRYTIGFESESVAHYRTFCAVGASARREAEASALYASAAYLTEVSNALAKTARQLKAIEARVPSSLLDRLRDCRWEVSDAQLTLFGVYELTASSYEILCGRQVARGVADPALLESLVEAPAAYSTTGRQAFQHQQEQAIRNAARIAGSRNQSSGARSVGATDGGGAVGGSGASSSTASGRSLECDRSGVRGGRGSRGRCGSGAAAWSRCL